MRYAVRIRPDDNGTFLVTFPDVPDAITYGDTIEEALAHASDALLTIFDAYMKDRKDIPAPSPLGSGASIELPPLETAKIELYRAMRTANINKTELARRLHWHMPQVDRVLDVHHASQLDQMDAAFSAIGKHLRITVEDAPPQVPVMATPRRGGRAVHAGAFAAAKGAYARMAATSRARTRKSAKKR